MQALLAVGAPFRVVQRGDRFYAEDGLTDLRLVTEGGRPVPHLLIQPPAPEREWIRGSILSVAATKKTSGFEVDLGAPPAVDMIRVEGLPVPHLKRLTLEGSGDRAHWTMLVAEGTLFDLPDEQLRQNTLGFAAGPYRYLRVTWNDANSGRVPNPSAVPPRRVSTAAPPPADDARRVDRASSERAGHQPVSREAAGGPAADRRAGSRRRSGAAGGHVYRRAIVSESRFAGLEAAPVELGRAMLSRVVRDGLTASALRVPIGRAGRSRDRVDDRRRGERAARSAAGVGRPRRAAVDLLRSACRRGHGAVRRSDAAEARLRSRGGAQLGRSRARCPRRGGVTGGAHRGRAPAAVTGLAPNAGPTLDPAAFTHLRAVEPARRGRR